ncbi:MAG: hypothetical protein FWG64_08310 [Firmicutes bacterium]|nr:hypothetical protein [Bacillota bacterium]
MKNKVIASALALVLALGASGVTAFASGIEDGALSVEIETFSSMLPNPMPDPNNGDHRPIVILPEPTPMPPVWRPPGTNPPPQPIPLSVGVN